MDLKHMQVLIFLNKLQEKIYFFMIFNFFLDVPVYMEEERGWDCMHNNFYSCI